MKRLAFIAFLLLLTCEYLPAPVIINSYRFVIVPSAETGRAYQTGLAYLNESHSVQYQELDGILNTAVFHTRQYQSGESFINKNANSEFQTREGFQN